MSDDVISTGLAGLTVAVTPPGPIAAEPLRDLGVEMGMPPIAQPPMTKQTRDLSLVLAGIDTDKLKPPALVALARDVALDIQPLHAILKNHGFTQDQYDYLTQHNDFFKHTLAQQAVEWQSFKSTQDRLRVEAAAALEQVLPSIAQRIGSNTEKLTEVVEGAKLLASIAGVDSKSGATIGSREGFSINIDLGGDTRVTVGLAPGATPAPEQKVVLDLQANAQGSADAKALRAVAKGEGEDTRIPNVASGTGSQGPVRQVAAGPDAEGTVRPVAEGKIKASDVSLLVAGKGLENGNS